VAASGVSGKVFTKISASGYYSMALESIGRVWVWGTLYYYNPLTIAGVGDGNVVQRSTPNALSSATIGSKTIVNIKASFGTALALASDGMMLGAGYTAYFNVCNANIYSHYSLPTGLL
jgi:alpha-tubulin suppressor-like RCC1 family protein